jgi:hypothetical protein
MTTNKVFGTSLFLSLLAPLLPKGTLPLFLLFLIPGLNLTVFLKRRFSFIELIALIPSCSILLWAIFSSLLLTVNQPALIPWWPAALSLFLLLFTLNKRPKKLHVKITTLDKLSPLILLPAIAFISIIYLNNGPFSSDADIAYTAKKWFARDSFYFFSLAQMALERVGWPTENPFLSGYGNYYPSLLQTGLAGLSFLDGKIAAITLCKVAPLIHIASIALLPVVILRLSGAKPHFIPALIATTSSIGFLTLRFDLYGYLHTNSLAFPLLLLFFWLIGPRPTIAPKKHLLMAVLVAFTLLLCHTITAIIAGIFMGTVLLQWLRKKKIQMALPGFLILFLWSLVFLWINKTPFSPPKGPFSLDAYSSYWEILLPWAIPFGCLLLLIFQKTSRSQMLYIPPILLSALAIGYFATSFTVAKSLNETTISNRFFIQYNAERFLHLAILSSLFLLLKTKHTTQVILALGLFISPILLPTRIMQRAANLTSNGSKEITHKDMTMFSYIRNNTNSGDNFFCYPEKNYLLPAFTGRSQGPAEKPNLWGTGTISPDDYQTFYNDYNTFYEESSSPHYFSSLYTKHKIDYLLIKRTNIDPDSISIWIQNTEQNKALKLIFASETYFLFQTTTPLQ